ncbi:MAG: hypothetical protein HQM14_10710 [SAR324 cluster bacterium]|nr:hypothetical protein [SAR324 cluster bacterium]
MIRFIFLIVFGYLAYRMVKKIISEKIVFIKKFQSAFDNNPQTEELLEDPYCHTFVAADHAHVRTINGKMEFFCSQQCADQFMLQQTPS